MQHALPNLLLFPATNDHVTSALIVSSLVAFRWHPPRCHRVAATRTPAFSAAVRMIHRIHRYSSDGGPNSTPTLGACLTQLTQIVLIVTDLANGSSAVDVYPPHLSGSQTQRRVPALTSDNLNRTARASGELTTFPRLHLYAMHEGTDRDVL